MVRAIHFTSNPERMRITTFFVFLKLQSIPCLILLVLFHHSTGFDLDGVKSSLPSSSMSKGHSGASSRSNGGKDVPVSKQINPIGPPTAVNLKRKKSDPKDYDKHNKNGSYTKVTYEEVECTQSMFMTPHHYPVPFSVNDTIYKRIDKSCRWSFIGTEPCIPKLSCDTAELKRPCTDEFLEVVDGNRGYMKVCGGSGKVEDIVAADDMRDLYIHFIVKNAPASASTKGSGSQSQAGKELFRCTVVCSSPGEGTPLGKGFSPKVNPMCFCGTKPNEDRIVGGENAKKFEFPWLVALVETNTRQPFCGGSIINNKMILTAAHCIKGKYMDYRNIQVVVNGHEFDPSPNAAMSSAEMKYYPKGEIEKMDRENGSSRHNIDEIIVHPLYVVDTNDFDVALLKLQDTLTLSPRRMEPGMSALQQPRAVCLPPLGSYQRTYSNQMAIVAGWGLPDASATSSTQVLQKLEVKVFSPKTCKEMYGHRVNRRMMCSGHREGGKDACSGDSGSPLVLEERPKVFFQIASVSWGEGCGEPDSPGVYFRATEVVQWFNYHSNFYNRGAGGDHTTEDENEKGSTWCITP